MATLAALGRHVGISSQAAGDQCQLLGIPTEGRGGYDLDAFRLAYCRRLREQAAGRAGGNGNANLAEERARLAREQADGQARANALARKELAPVADIGLAVRTVIEVSKARLLRVPARVAGDDDALKTKVRDALNEAFEDLSTARVSEIANGQDDEFDGGDGD